MKKDLFNKLLMTTIMVGTPFVIGPCKTTKAIVIPGAISTEADWAIVSAYLEKYSDVTVQTSPLVNNMMGNRLSAAQYTGNGMINIMQGGNGWDSRGGRGQAGMGANQVPEGRGNILSGQAGRSTDGISYWFGHNDTWGSILQGDSGTYAVNDGKVSLGGMELTVKNRGANADSVYQIRQNIKEARLESVFGAKNTANSDSIITVLAWTSDGINAYDIDNSLAIMEVFNNGNAPVEMQVDLWVPEKLVYNNTASVDAMRAYPYESAIDDEGRLLLVQRQTNRLNNAERGYNPEDIIANADDYTARVAMVTGIRGSSFSGSKTNGKGTASAEFTVPANGKVELVTYFRPTNAGAAHYTDIQGAMREALKSMPENRAAALDEYKTGVRNLDIAALRTQHLNWWKNYWLKAYVQIPETHDAVAKHWYGAQYATGCTQRSNMPHPGSMWANMLLQDGNGWGGRYFLNYNHQAQYYGSFSSNRADAVLPLARVIDWWDVPTNHAATANAGYEGICRQRTATPFAMYRNRVNKTTPVSEIRTHTPLGNSRDQKSNTAFVIVPIMWYWDYTLDHDYLNRYAAPLASEGLDFYMSYAKKYTDDTPWLHGRGVNPENNTTYTDTADKWKVPEGLDFIYMIEGSSVHESDWQDLSPGLDIAGSERLARFLIEAAPHLNSAELSGKLYRWKDYLKHLSPFPQKTFPKLSGTDKDGFAIIGFSESHNPPLDAKIQNRWGNEVTVITAAYAITPMTTNITNEHAFVIEPWDQLVELEPVFPFESKMILNDPQMVKRAIDTVDFMQAWHYHPEGRAYKQWTTSTRYPTSRSVPVTITNGLANVTGFGNITNTFCKTFPIVARLGYDPGEILYRFKASNAMTSDFRNSNLLAYQTGGGFETVGATEMLNSMLMQSDLEGGRGIIRVFPNWTGEDASFTRLLGKGAFEVSSELKNGKIQYIAINSKAGAPCSVENPWNSAVTVRKASGEAVSYEIRDGYINFDTIKEESYIIRKK